LSSGLQKTHLFCDRVRFGRSRSFKVIQGQSFWYQSKAHIRCLRLLSIYSAVWQIGKWFRDAFTDLKKAPRYLVPCYFDALVTGVYNIAEEVFWNKMSPYVCFWHLACSGQLSLPSVRGRWMNSNWYLVILVTKNSELLPENIAGWRPLCGWLRHRWFCLAAGCGSKVRSFRQWVATNCAVLPTTNASQYATLLCKMLLFCFSCKQRYINVRFFYLLTSPLVLTPSRAFAGGCGNKWQRVYHRIEPWLC